MNDESKVLSAERRFFDSLTTADTEGLDRILADDFVLIDLSGALLSKASLRSVVGSDQLRFESIEPLESLVRFYETTAIVTGRTRMSGQFIEAPFTAESRYTHVYVEIEGELRLVTAQGTPVQAI